MSMARQTTRIRSIVGRGLAGLIPALAIAFAGAAEAHEWSVGYERGVGAEAFSAQGLTADHPQIDRLVAHLKGRIDADWGFWLDLGRGAYQFDDLDFPGTAHLRHETRLATGVSRAGALLGGTWTLGAGYGLQLLQVQNSAQLNDSEPAYFFLPWQLLHGLTLSESVRLGFGPVAFALDAQWAPFLFAHLADSRLAMPTYLTSFRVAPRLSILDDRLSLGYAFERTLGDGFQRQSDGPFLSFAVTGF